MTAAQLNVIGLMAVYNEDDILDQTIAYTISQGLKLIVLDNGSTDRSYEIAASYLGNGVLSVRRVPTETFEWAILLRMLCQWAWEFEAHWCVLVDADTFLESPRRRLTLLDAIRQEADLGHNVIKFNNFEFWPTPLDPSDEPDVRKRVTYYTYNDDNQEKCWANLPGVDIAQEAGHQVFYPPGIEKSISPNHFVMRHYKIRSYEHGLRKVFQQRQPRFRGQPEGWHIQYSWMSPARECFVRDPSTLTKYEEDGQWNLTPTLGRDGRPLR